MYDPKFRLGWNASDSLAKKYYPISPYAFCANNPVRFIGPTGEDIWEMDYDGRIRWIEKSDIHIMRALDKGGARTGQSITVQDRTIFDGLTATGETSDYAASYTGGNPTELASIFLFGADNSNAEWRFSRYDEGNGDQYAIGTVHNDGLAISPEQMGFARENEIAFIHSHPGGYKSLTGPNSEHSSMGSLPGGRIIQPSDSWNVYNNSGRYPGNKNSFVYFPNSGNIHHVRGVSVPALIRNISNHGNKGQRLFWGTLNGR